MDIESEFFEGKRPWSKIKDKVLGGYLPPYLKKVQYLGHEIILIDCFAGPGKFEDGEIGSPLMICQIAEQHVPGRYKAFLVNNNQTHHESLENLLDKFIKQGSAFTMYGDAKGVLDTVGSVVGSQTIFIYLDPFGLKEFDFASLLPYLKRSKEFSSEILINVSVPIIHRLSRKKVIKETGIINETTKACHDRISAALGGDFWKKYILNEELSPKDQILKLIEEYILHLKKYLPYVGACPVYETTEGSAIKYFIAFASRHIDSQILLNDIMFDAYQEHIWKSETIGTLFEAQQYETVLPPKYFRELKEIVFSSISKENISRLDLWKEIVVVHFMKFKSKDFRNVVKELIKEKKIDFLDVKGTGKLNDDSILKINKK